jgi:hypothetical protein
MRVCHSWVTRARISASLSARALGRAQVVAFAHQRGDGAFGVQDALALHLGGVGGEHRRDVGVLQGLRDVGGAVVGAVQAFEGQRQRAFLQVALAFRARRGGARGGGLRRCWPGG